MARNWVLASTGNIAGSLIAYRAAISGHSAAAAYSTGGKYGNASSVDGFDLTSGKQLSSTPVSCNSGDCAFNGLAINASQFTAWDISQRLTQGPCSRCYAEAIYTKDDQGVRLLDSASASNGTQLANLTIFGNELTWTNDGNPRSAKLG